MEIDCGEEKEYKDIEGKQNHARQRKHKSNTFLMCQVFLLFVCIRVTDLAGTEFNCMTMKMMTIIVIILGVIITVIPSPPPPPSPPHRHHHHHHHLQNQ